MEAGRADPDAGPLLTLGCPDVVRSALARRPHRRTAHLRDRGRRPHPRDQRSGRGRRASCPEAIETARVAAPYDGVLRLDLVAVNAVSWPGCRRSTPGHRPRRNGSRRKLVVEGAVVEVAVVRRLPGHLVVERDRVVAGGREGPGDDRGVRDADLGAAVGEKHLTTRWAPLPSYTPSRSIHSQRTPRARPTSRPGWSTSASAH